MATVEASKAVKLARWRFLVDLVVFSSTGAWVWVWGGASFGSSFSIAFQGSLVSR